jgi:hypothetical protein
MGKSKKRAMVFDALWLLKKIDPILFMRANLSLIQDNISKDTKYKNNTGPNYSWTKKMGASSSNGRPGLENVRRPLAKPLHKRLLSRVFMLKGSNANGHASWYTAILL